MSGKPRKPTDKLCGAKLKGRNGTCKHSAGANTGHLGVGRCWLHGGASPKAEVAGQVEVAREQARVMGVELPIAPHDAILKCIAIAAGEVAYCTDRIAELKEDDAIVQSVLTTDRPLKWEKGAESPESRVVETKTESPRLHVWIVARREAMDRLVSYSSAALKAGVEERLVRVAEQTASQLAEAFKQFAVAMGHDPSAPKTREAMRRSLTLIAGGKAA